jgi:hypothetical protein
MRIDPDIVELEKDCHRIVTLICWEQVSDDEIDRRIARLRDRTTSVFPERPDVFDRTFGRRFKRLRTRFQPQPGLFSAG